MKASIRSSCGDRRGDRQSLNAVEDRCEQIPRDHNFSQLERHVLGVPCNTAFRPCFLSLHVYSRAIYEVCNFVPCVVFLKFLLIMECVKSAQLLRISISLSLKKELVLIDTTDRTKPHYEVP